MNDHPAGRRPDPDAAGALAARFERATRPLLDSLYAAAMHLTRDHADAEDLVQDTCLAAFRAFGRLGPDANLRAWMFRILTNANIDAYRRRRSRPRIGWAGEPTDEQLVAADIPVPRGLRSAESEVLDRLCHSEIADALRQLPEEFRITVYLADVADLGYREIARRTGVSLGTVNTRVHRGRRRLRELLSDLARDNGLLNAA